jgi:uncharacterized protein DUF5989
MNTVTKVHTYYSLISEFSMYLKETKSYWLAPVIFVLLALSALAFFLEGSVLAPAIYSVF